ncbi:unnamed protein product, partial [Rotaria sp. Silwood2]
MNPGLRNDMSKKKYLTLFLICTFDSLLLLCNDDDDTQSVDFLSRSNGMQPNDDDESLNSSRSSLQQPPSAIF